MTKDLPENSPQKQLKKFVEMWAANGPLLAEIHDRELRGQDTAAAIRSFESAFRIVLRDLPPRRSSGLVEWHQRLRRGWERG